MVEKVTSKNCHFVCFAWVYVYMQGYCSCDFFVVHDYRIERLVEMYMAEGYPEDKAQALAVRLKRGLKAWHMKEKRFWRRARKHEVQTGREVLFSLIGGKKDG